MNSFDFYDPHLSLLIVKFLKSVSIYEPKSLESAHKRLTEKILSESKKKSTNELKQAQLLLDLIAKDSQCLSLMKSNQSSSLFSYLQSKLPNVSQSLTELYELALLEYNLGKYKDASDKLYNFRLIANASLVPQELMIKAHWGKLATDILSDSIDYAFTDLNTLIQEIENQSNSQPSLMVLTQRAWICHWALFVYFKHPNGKEALLDLFLKPTYLNAIQMVCPWLLRYLVVNVLVCKKNIKEMTRILSSCDERIIMEDPILSFYDSLYCNLDLERARNEFKKCALEQDYFLVSLKDSFTLAARHCLFEILLRIYSFCTLEQVGHFMNLPVEKVKDWIVKSGLDVQIQDSVSCFFTMKLFDFYKKISMAKVKNEEDVMQRLDLLLKKSMTFGALLEKKDPLTLV